MKVRIHSSVLDLFPDMEVFVLVVLGVDIQKLSMRIVDLFYKPDIELAQEVRKTWKDIHRGFLKDKKSRASIEYLVSASHKQTLKHIHPLVDLYNQASLLSLSPFGGEDIHFLCDNFMLSTSHGSESFLPLGKEQIENPKAGEIVWLDGINRVVCRALNWLESDIHKITENTYDVIFVSERPIKSLPNPEIGIKFLMENLNSCSLFQKSFTLNSVNSEEDIIIKLS